MRINQYLRQQAFSRHLWYLSEIMISLSFFYLDTCLSKKIDMVQAQDVVGSEKNNLHRMVKVDLFVPIGIPVLLS